MNTAGHFSPSPLHQRAVIIAIVLTLHVAVLTVWIKTPRAAIVQHEMEVTVALMRAPAAANIEPLPTRRVPKKTVVQPVPAEQPEVPEEPVTERAAPIIEQPVTAHAAPVIETTSPASVEVPALSDIEPNYKASYLNNRLTYPLAARRAGIEGRVVLNVEVLAEGVSGQVQVHQSSGHVVLDRAALASVKTWRFVPARRAGRNVTEWFKIPILFSLKDNET